MRIVVDEHLKTETNYTLTLKEISTELDRETKQATVRHPPFA